MEDKVFTTTQAIIFLIIIVAVLGLLYGAGIIISVYPRKFWINKMHKRPMLDMDVYYFYYQKATAYRMLFIVHTIFANAVKTLGSTMTFITVYCAIDSNDYILLFSLIAAMCQVIGMLIPTDRYAKVYVEASRLLEYELNTNYNDEITQKGKLKDAYEKAEEIIQRNFI